MDYGLAISQKGYPADNCPDRFLAFSSSFQTLKIFNRYSVTGTVPASGVNTITITHNIGFYAPFYVVYNGTGNNISRIKNTSVRNYQNRVEIDIENGFMGLANGTTVYFTVYVFLSDFSAVDPEDIVVSGAGGAAGVDWGLRISKDGYDAETCTDDQLIFSSSFFTNIVHLQGNGGHGGTLSVDHGLGYIPSAMVYGRQDGTDFIIPARGLTFYLNPLFGGNTGLMYGVDETNLFVGYNDLDPIEFGSMWRTDFTYYYIIFKKPLT